LFRFIEKCFPKRCCSHDTYNAFLSTLKKFLRSFSQLISKHVFDYFYRNSAHLVKISDVGAFRKLYFMQSFGRKAILTINKRCPKTSCLIADYCSFVSFQHHECWYATKTWAMSLNNSFFREDLTLFDRLSLLLGIETTNSKNKITRCRGPSELSLHTLL